MTNKELLAEARQRYPVGTKYYVAHLTGRTPGYEDIVREEDFDLLEHSIKNSKDNHTDVLCLHGQNIGVWSRCLYKNGRWAEIISSPVPKQLPIFN